MWKTERDGAVPVSCVWICSASGALGLQGDGSFGGQGAQGAVDIQTRCVRSGPEKSGTHTQIGL